MRFWRTALFCGLWGADKYKHVPRGILLIPADTALQFVVISALLNNQSSTSYERTERIAGLSCGNLTVTYFVYANRLVLHVAMWPLERGVFKNLVGLVSEVTTQSGRVASAEGFYCLTVNTLLLCVNIHNVDQRRSVGIGKGILKLGSKGWWMAGSESWPLYLKRESFRHFWIGGQGGLQRQTVWTWWRKKPLPSSGLLTQNVRPVVLSKGLLSHLWSLKGCPLSSTAVTGKSEVLVTDGVCKCALVLKSLRDISTNGLFPGCVDFWR